MHADLVATKEIFHWELFRHIIHSKTRSIWPTWHHQSMILYFTAIITKLMTLKCCIFRTQSWILSKYMRISCLNSISFQIYRVLSNSVFIAFFLSFSSLHWTRRAVPHLSHISIQIGETFGTALTPLSGKTISIQNPQCSPFKLPCQLLRVVD